MIPQRYYLHKHKNSCTQWCLEDLQTDVLFVFEEGLFNGASVCLSSRHYTESQIRAIKEDAGAWLDEHEPELFLMSVNRPENQRKGYRIGLPAPVAAFLDRHGNPSEYIRELLEAEMKRENGE